MIKKIVLLMMLVSILGSCASREQIIREQEEVRQRSQQVQDEIVNNDYTIMLSISANYPNRVYRFIDKETDLVCYVLIGSNGTGNIWCAPFLE